MLELLTHEEALKFIGECERRSVRILGMEFFLVDDNGSYEPVGIADWSALAAEPIDKTWSESRRILRSGIPDGGNRVEFTVDP